MVDIESLKSQTFFKYVWTKKPKKCQCGCGMYLPNKLNTCCMDHLLEKSTYPECKYSILNIAYFTPDCHTRKTNGYANDTQKEVIEIAKSNYDTLVQDSSDWEKRFENLINNTKAKIIQRENIEKYKKILEEELTRINKNVEL